MHVAAERAGCRLEVGHGPTLRACTGRREGLSWCVCFRRLPRLPVLIAPAALLFVPLGGARGERATNIRPESPRIFPGLWRRFTTCSAGSCRQAGERARENLKISKGFAGAAGQD